MTDKYLDIPCFSQCEGREEPIEMNCMQKSDENGLARYIEQNMFSVNSSNLLETGYG